MRLVGGTFILAAFVLVTAYNSVFISFITAPHSYPLVETVADVAEKSNVKLATSKGLAIDLTLSVSIHIFKSLLVN